MFHAPNLEEFEYEAADNALVMDTFSNAYD